MVVLFWYLLGCAISAVLFKFTIKYLEEPEIDNDMVKGFLIFTAFSYFGVIILLYSIAVEFFKKLDNDEDNKFFNKVKSWLSD